MATSHIVCLPTTAGTDSLLGLKAIVELVGRKPACLPGCLSAAIYESHALLSLKCPWGLWRVYLFSLLRVTSIQGVDWAAIHCFYVHLRYHIPAKRSRYHLCCCTNKFLQCFIMYGCLTLSPIAPWEPYLRRWYGLNHQGHPEACVPVC